MMSLIAERELVRQGRTYQVRLEAPIVDDSFGATMYRCDWELIDESGTVALAMAGYGDDSVQALILTLAMIGDTLAVEPGGLFWHGEPGTGFLRTRIGGDGIPQNGWDWDWDQSGALMKAALADLDEHSSDQPDDATPGGS